MNSAPRNVRNFFLSLSVDGRKSTVETGPVRADGGFTPAIRIRKDGRISDEVLYIDGIAGADGRLKVISYIRGRADDTGDIVLLSGNR